MADIAEEKEKLQANILSRLRKVEGQIRGLQAMVTAGKGCEEILNQLRAAQSALKSAGALVLKRYLTQCYGELSAQPDSEEAYRKLEQTVELLARFVGG